MDQRPTRSIYEPTPEQIAETTAEIRRGWSRAEELNRRGLPAYASEAWTPPELGVPTRTPAQAFWWGMP